jgi:hypothetical protein
MEVFSLVAQVLGTTRSDSVTGDGVGFTAQTSTGPQSARSLRQAIEIVRRDLGPFLQRAERSGVPWGLRVSVGAVSAVYGEFPGFPGSPSAVDRSSPVVRIRSQWHDGQGPLAALENALRIVEAYAGRRAAA